MAFQIGKIDCFDANTESWLCYQERLDQYFVANDVVDEKKVPALLSLIGSSSYRLLRDICHPDLPSTKDYKTLCDKLKDHFSPKPLVIAERFRFHKRDQHPDESVKDFNVALRKLSEYCDFGANLLDSLRDRFVCGLRNDAIQKKLLSVDKLTHEKALEIALAMESASKDVIELQNKQIPVQKIKIRKPKKTAEKQYHKSDKQPQKSTACYHCARTNHNPFECKFKNSICYKCQKTGHITPACKPQFRKSQIHSLETEQSESASDTDTEFLKTVTTNTNGKSNREAIHLTPCINGKNLSMELDTGAGVSVISQADYEKHFSDLSLKDTDLKLRSYSGEEININGMINCEVSLDGQTKQLNLYVVQGDEKPLFGREWIHELQLDTVTVNKLKFQPLQQVEHLKEKYKDIFSPELGKLKDIKAKLHLKDNATPKFVKARPVPYALKPKIDKELDHLVERGILEKVSYSDWATPIVPVPKPNGNVRICGDFKVTLNPVLEVDKYPLPRTDDIFASLSQGQMFSKIDLKDAYLQMEVDDSTKELLTINTHKGLFRYTRLAYGTASAPAIFQRTIEQVMSGVPGTQVILDDMIVTGKTDQEHLENLEMVFQRLSENGLRANVEKCKFFKEKITFCGHEIDRSGLHKIQSKIDAVVNAPKIENVEQLRSFLGLVQYYSKFLPNLSTILRPLHELLVQGKQWKWTQRCEDAVNKVKQLITSDVVLTHYNPDLPVTLACDASSYGLGCVLSHIMPDGTEQPIAFASRTLNSAEKNYSQIDKEALSIVWSVKKFELYLLGRHFTLITDHRPLLSIFSPTKGVSVTTAARLQRYALFLAGHDYDIRYKNTKTHGNCDSLSRLPVSSKSKSNEPDSTDIFYVSQFESLPITAKAVHHATVRDQQLSRVYDAVARGWNDNCDKELEPYYSRRNELSLHQGCLIWGLRVVIPPKLRSGVLRELHSSHLGMVKMKTLARSYVWWPGIDREIEKLTKSCSGCITYKKNPPEAPIHPWEFPSKPWSRIHIDFAGPFLGSMYLIIVDAYSKWPIVKIMKTTTSSKVVEELRTVFADNGLPDTLVSDNAPNLVSEEMNSFLKSNGVKHITSSPYHPKTNGLAERFVQSFKQAMKAAKSDSGTVQSKMSKFLIMYRNSVHSTTGECPSTLFLGRKLTTRLDLLKPNLSGTVQKSQSKMVRSTVDRDYEVGQTVAVKDYRGNDPKWIPGTISDKTGPVSYRVEVGPDVNWRRHADQIQDSHLHVKEGVMSDINTGVDLPIIENQPIESQSPAAISGSTPRRVTSPSEKPASVVTSERRYPVRDRKPVIKLNL